MAAVFGPALGFGRRPGGIRSSLASWPRAA